MKTIILTLFIILVLANWLIPEPDIRYANRDGSFTFSEMNVKGRDFAMCVRKFEQFKQQETGPKTLYRIDSRHWWAVWYYRYYVTGSKYRLPYISYDSLRLRTLPHPIQSGYQDFVR